MRAEQLTVAAEQFDRPGVQSILFAARDEFDRVYGEGNRGAHDLVDAEFAPPRGTYLVARDGGHIAGGVGLRGIADPALRIGEVKRLWVRPDLRHHGVARRLMAELMDVAVGLGYAELYLETGPRQPDAKALYDGLGWQRVDAYPSGAHVHDTGTRFHLVLTPSNSPQP